MVVRPGLLLAFAASICILSDVRAQQAGTSTNSEAAILSNGTGVLIAPSSNSQKVIVTGKRHKVLMAHSRELPAGSLIYVKNGKLYLVTDGKIPDGGMLFDDATGWDPDK